MRKILNNLNEIDDLLIEDRLILFGAGRTCYSILKYLADKDISLQKIFCIAVSDKAYNLDAVMGVPVCLIDEIDSDDADSILVTVFERKQEEVFELLEEYGFSDCYAVSNLLYARLRQETDDLSIDILTNTQWIRDDIRGLRRELRIRQDVVERRLAVIEKKSNEITQTIFHIGTLEKQVSDLRNQGIKLQNKLDRLNQIAMQQGGWYYEETINPKYYEPYLRNWYMEKTGKQLDLDNPKTFNEKIQWIKLHGVTPLMTRLADKYAVREWVAEKIGKKYLIPLLGVYESFEDIDFNKLPDQFVLKCTHGSGWNEIVKDKNTLNTYWLKRKFDRWMNTNYAFVAGLELQYRDITPRIIAEEYVPELLSFGEYQFWCFNGDPKFVSAVSDPHGENKKFSLDMKWNKLSFVTSLPGAADNINFIPDSGTLDLMRDLVSNICKEFEFARVDLFYVNKRILFSEMTFTPASGLVDWKPESYDTKLGKQLYLN